MCVCGDLDGALESGHGGGDIGGLAKHSHRQPSAIERARHTTTCQPSSAAVTATSPMPLPSSTAKSCQVNYQSATTSSNFFRFILNEWDWDRSIFSSI
jgi:hypothetical protein